MATPDASFESVAWRRKASFLRAFHFNSCYNSPHCLIGIAGAATGHSPELEGVSPQANQPLKGEVRERKENHSW
jgi:hypothetical protein